MFIDQLLPQSFLGLTFWLVMLVSAVYTLIVILPMTRQSITWRFQRHRRLPYYLIVSGIISFMLSIVMFYAYYIEPNTLEINELRIDAESVQLTDPIKLVLVADLQQQGTESPQYVEYVVDQINRQQADIVVFGGDLIESSPQDLMAFSALADIQADNKYAILGNHDYSKNQFRSEPRLDFGEQVADFWQAQGFNILQNSSVQQLIRGYSFDFVGLDSYWYNLHDFDAINQVAAANRVDYRILLAHSPLAVEDNSQPDLYDLTLSGHCHGGQVSFGIVNSLLNLPVTPPGCYRQAGLTHGQFQINGQRVVVTKGVGSADPKIRFGVPPEILVLNIY